MALYWEVILSDLERSDFGGHLLENIRRIHRDHVGRQKHSGGQTNDATVMISIGNKVAYSDQLVQIGRCNNSLVLELMNHIFKAVFNDNSIALVLVVLLVGMRLHTHVPKELHSESVAPLTLRGADFKLEVVCPWPCCQT
jgi:hypothetical protein